MSTPPVQFLEGSEGVDFEWEENGKKLSYKLSFKKRPRIGLKEDKLARAIGYKKNDSFAVLDLSAGLAKDAFHMACLGLNVTALEREPQIAKALLGALSKLESQVSLRILENEAKEYLLGLTNDGHLPEVIYFDPMFPAKKKSSLPSKELRLLQLLAQTSDTKSERDILDLALLKCQKRLVVKRPLYAPPIKEKPDVVIKGKSVRYDIYLASYI